MNAIWIDLAVIFLALLRLAVPVIVLLLLGAWLGRRPISEEKSGRPA